jgi:protein-S-isoprenylcysteine O-methyltransferase Ste14
VTTGPYRYIRHPIYTAACLIAWPAPLAYRSPLGIALAALLTVGAVIRMLFEERMVTERYPEYRDYAARTRRMVPFLF